MLLAPRGRAIAFPLIHLAYFDVRFLGPVRTAYPRGMGPKAGGMRINFRPGRAARWSSASILVRRHRLLSVAVIGQPSASSPVILTIAKMPALTDSVSVGQASTTSAKAGSIGSIGAPTAPDFAAPCLESAVFFEVFVDRSSPCRGADTGKA